MVSELNKHRWCVTRDGYAMRRLSKELNLEGVYLHRQLALTPNGLDVDHRNGFKLDNTRRNLRPATRSQNSHNRPKANLAASSRFKGVSWDRRRRNWRACIKVDYRFVHLGNFTSEPAAANAYDQAALKYYGEFAKLNSLEEAST